MPKDVFMPEGFFPVSGHAVASDSGGWSTDIINLANTQMCYIFVHKTIAVAASTAHTPYMGADVVTCATVLPVAVPIWTGSPTTTTTALTRQTDAANYTQPIGALAGEYFLIFKIDPQVLGTGYSTVKLTIAASGQANITSVVFWLLPRYPERAVDRAALDFIS
jgi:hypothetical protein